MGKARHQINRGRQTIVAVVRGLSLASTTGHINLGHSMFRCAMGRSGRRAAKWEGDGATPIGTFAVRRILYRQDRSVRILSSLPARPIQSLDGWCDQSGDRNYNRLVKHPYPASAEKLWRDDHLYDIIVILGHNDLPRGQRRGSAIFMHLAREGFKPTEGCIALKANDLRRLVAVLTPGSKLKIRGP
jgi:L,D-peptidoglycan transpeptidase YkuD (ErfK/YbiS/YcfS/YnhG family)